MTERYEAASVVVTSQVQNDRPQVCRGPSHLVDAAGVASEPKERLLHDVLRRIAVIDEQSRQPDQRTTLGVEQPDDELLRLDADRLALESRRLDRHRQGRQQHGSKLSITHRRPRTYERRLIDRAVASMLRTDELCDRAGDTS